MRRLFSLFLLCILLLAAPRPAGGKSIQPQLAGPTGCGYSDTTADLLADTDLAHWSAWVADLSGAQPVSVSGQQVIITSRYSYALFNGTSPAYNFVREQILNWYPAAQIEEDAYQPPVTGSPTWKNLVLTIPGADRAQESVILSAHLDSTSRPDPEQTAPGADDNATGAATLLEAARILRGHSLPRTLRLIWFTGEEQYMLGSAAYVRDHPLDGLVGVINVDMIGYDGDNDRCFELHVGTLPASDRVGRCFSQSIGSYGIPLKYDYLTGAATNASDHASFWNKNIGAVEVLENVFSNDPTQPGCSGSDENPNYHTPLDTYANVSLPYSFNIARAAIATAISLASPLPQFPIYFPLVKN